MELIEHPPPKMLQDVKDPVQGGSNDYPDIRVRELIPDFVYRETNSILEYWEHNLKIINKKWLQRQDSNL
ncbi:MAG: hypothetical protein N2487_01665 [Verrucomicrobiae bacterium]|nr:hypothetical protein [Verrucomicrobiae bacterium]